MRTLLLWTAAVAVMFGTGVGALPAAWSAAAQEAPACGETPPPAFQQPASSPLVLTVSTARPVYAPGEAVIFGLSVRNPTGTAVTIRTSLLDDYRVTDGSGTEVWRLSSFALRIPRPRYCTFGPGAEAHFSFLWDQRGRPPDPAGAPVAPGVYTVVGALIGEPGEPGPTSAPVQLRIGSQTPEERVTLVAGCTNVTLTWPAGTSLETVAAAVSPAGSLIAIWRLDPAMGRFLGFSPQPGAPNDLTTVSRLDAVFVCLRERGALIRPAI